MKVKKYIYNPDKKGVFRVSIVEKPANKADSVLMSEQNIKGVMYSPVLIPDLKIPRIDEKTGEQWLGYFDADTIEKLMYNYMKQGGNLGTNIEHQDENTDGIYPVEIWIVKDPKNDKSVALGMPNQVKGTCIMGFKCDNPEALQMIKDKLLNGLSIEGQLDEVEDTESPISKFNIHLMAEEKKETLATKLLNTIMSAIKEEEKPEEKEVEKMEEETPLDEEKKEVEEMEAEVPAEAPSEPTDLEKELETAKATIEQLEKENADLKAEIATYKNEATLMSEQVVKIEKAFEDYKTTKMSSVKVGDLPAKKIEVSGVDAKHTEFLKQTMSKLQ